MASDTDDDMEIVDAEGGTQTLISFLDAHVCSEPLPGSPARRARYPGRHREGRRTLSGCLCQGRARSDHRAQQAGAALHGTYVLSTSYVRTYVRTGTWYAGSTLGRQRPECVDEV
jgi:hypothetical protein